MFENIKKALSDFTIRKLQGDDDVTLAEAYLDDAENFKHTKEEFERSVITDIKHRYEDRRKLRMDNELQWRLNINFYNGDQFTTINREVGDVEEIPSYTDWEERNVFNEIASITETRFAFLSKRKNHMKNRPASSSTEDRVSAKIGNKILASTGARLRMSDKQQDANLLAGVMGTAVWKTWWDSSRGRTVGYQEIELSREDADRLPLQEYEKRIMGESVNTTKRIIREGDVNTTVHSPFEFYPENPNKPLRENRRVMHCVLMSPEEVFERWGVVEEGTSEITFRISGSSNRTYGGAVSGRFFGSSLSVAPVKNVVRVYEEHELPSPSYPQGRLIICTDHHLMHYGVLPETFGVEGEPEFCFDVQQSLRTDGFFGKSLIERLIPVQMKYNALKNRKQDYINRVTIGVLVAQEGSVPDMEYWRMNGIGPGDIIEYSQGYNEPHFLTPPQLPSTFEDEEANILTSFNRLSGISQLAQQSITPSYVTSGVAVSSLAEQDDTRIGLEAENINQCLSSIGKKWLALYRKHVVYPRMVRDIGRNEEFEISQFVGSDLTSFDVFIELETELGDTLSQRRQKVIELLNSGLFNDTETGHITNEGRIKVFEMLQLGNWEDFVDADNNQIRKAERENNLMMLGKEPTLRSFDDDAIHIAKHRNFQLMPEYEELLEKHPELDELFESHVEAHLHNLELKTQEEQGVESEVGTSATMTDNTEPAEQNPFVQ